MKKICSFSFTLKLPTGQIKITSRCRHLSHASFNITCTFVATETAPREMLIIVAIKLALFKVSGLA